MKQAYIIHEHHPQLLLFFAGWGADATPFREYRPAHSDFMICYDYRDLAFDASCIDEHRCINVVGWSMGVWAAAQLLPQLTLQYPGRIHSSIALNGTPFPIDDRRGIPQAIFRGTLEGLTGASLHKFLRRMCADSAAFRAFLQVTPRRPLEELREELEKIMKNEELRMKNEELRMKTDINEELGMKNEESAFCWQHAIVGSNDRIIPPANQLQSWQALGVPVTETDDAHYQEPLFRHYLQDTWTND